VLDEPTTHLDIATREAMEQVFLEYDGTILFVSHDRHLISLLAKNLWILDNSSITEFNGSFDEWQSTLESRSIKHSHISNDTRMRVVSDSSKNQSLIRLQQRQIDELEEEISELEESINKIEYAISEASETQNVVELTRLGQTYESLQLELAEKWKELGG
jgi:ATP-binding cassette subfamily F protein 3